MDNKKFTSAIILAGGVGSRMKSNITKQKMEICGRSVLARTVSAFAKADTIDEIIVVCREEELGFAKAETAWIKKPVKYTVGGKTRKDSARCGFSAISDEAEYVAVHDAARCMIAPSLINEVARAAHIHRAASAVAPLTDTVKKVNADGFIVDTVPRDTLKAAGTPQIFERALYKKALEAAQDTDVTDDNMMVELIGVPVFAVESDEFNFKITTQKDINFAEYLLARPEGIMNNFKIGHGYDVHKLVEGRRLIIGGVDIPHTMGLLGHSDADVLTHAVMDAVLGALALGDIGKHFPDTAEEYKGISSMSLLTRVAKMMMEMGYTVSNIDATLILQKPKVAPFIAEMRKNIAFGLGIDPSLVNVKATTEEHLGFTGREEGVAAHAVALLEKIAPKNPLD